MIRSKILCVVLSLFCSLNMHGMVPAGGVIPDTSLKAIGRDILRGGLIIPGLVAAGIIILLDEKLKQDIKMGQLHWDTASIIAMGLCVSLIPTWPMALGFTLRVKKNDATEHARKMCNVVRCCYGLFALYLMHNAVDLILG